LAWSATSARAQGIGWTISASATDPFVNTGTPGMPGTLTTLYIWYACNTTPSGGLTAMKAALSPFPLTYPSVMNGFLNSGTNPPIPVILLVIGGCPAPPLAPASMMYINTGLGLDVRIVPEPFDGLHVSVDCDENGWPNRTIGYSEIGPPYQDFLGEMCSSPISIEEQTWTRMKGLYQ
jgi:hypothetical protein